MANYRTLGRVQMKSDTTAHWNAATTFIPLNGEIIVYSDQNRFKIGDGYKTLSELDFSKSLPRTKVVDTLDAASWTGGDINAKYSFEDTYPSTLWNIDIELSSTQENGQPTTSAQFKAYGKAGMVGSATENVITAIQSKPTIDIPVILTLEAK